MEIDLTNAHPCPDCRQCLTNADKCRYCAERDQLRAEVERLRAVGPRADVGPNELMRCTCGHLYRLAQGCVACLATARAEAAQAHAADLRGALEAGRAERWAATVGNTETDAFSPSPWVIAAEALLDRLEKESANALANS